MPSATRAPGSTHLPLLRPSQHFSRDVTGRHAVRPRRDPQVCDQGAVPRWAVFPRVAPTLRAALMELTGRDPRVPPDSRRSRSEGRCGPTHPRCPRDPIHRPHRPHPRRSPPRARPTPRHRPAPPHAAVPSATTEGPPRLRRSWEPFDRCRDVIPGTETRSRSPPAGVTCGLRGQSAPGAVIREVRGRSRLTLPTPSRHAGWFRFLTGAVSPRSARTNDPRTRDSWDVRVNEPVALPRSRRLSTRRTVTAA